MTTRILLSIGLAASIALNVIALQRWYDAANYALTWQSVAIDQDRMVIETTETLRGSQELLTLCMERYVGAR